MASQDKSQSNTKGKAREDLVATSDFRPTPQVNPDALGSDKSGQMSLFDLDTLSTAPPLDQANKRIGNWLKETETLLGNGGPSIQNQENVPLFGDASPAGREEQIKEIEALTKGPLNKQGNSGTIAPTNTPQSCDDPDLRGRALSAGGSAGKRPRMGPQAKTMEDSDLPRPLFPGPRPLFSETRPLFSGPRPLFSGTRPLFSRPNSSTVRGKSSSLPDDIKSSTTPDEVNSNGSGLPIKSVKRSSSTHARIDTSVWIKKHLNPTQTTASTSQPSTSTPPAAGPAVNRSNLLRHLLEQHRGLPPTAAKYILDNAAKKPPAPTQSEPSFSPQPLPGSTVNAHGLAQPPSPLSFQHAENGPVPGSARTDPGEVATEPRSVRDSPPASQFQHSRDVGCQHSSDCQTVMRPARPRSRAKRITEDCKQLWKDCFYRSPVIRLSAGDFVDRAINAPGRVVTNERRHGSQHRDIFERAGDTTAENARSNLPSLNGRLRDSAASQSDYEPRGDSNLPPNGRTLSNESSNTAHEASTTSCLPTNGLAWHKRILQRWKAKWEAASRERARIRREPPVFVWD